MGCPLLRYLAQQICAHCSSEVPIFQQSCNNAAVLTNLGSFIVNPPSALGLHITLQATIQILDWVMSPLQIKFLMLLVISLRRLTGHG